MVVLRRVVKSIKYGILGCFGIKEQKVPTLPPPTIFICVTAKLTPTSVRPRKGDRLPYDVAWALDERCISRPIPHGERRYRHGNFNKSYHDTTRSGNTPNMHYAFYMEFPPNSSSSPAATVAA